MNRGRVGKRLEDERQGVTVMIRPPIFRKEIENEKKCANFKGNFGLLREMLV